MNEHFCACATRPSAASRSAATEPAPRSAAWQDRLTKGTPPCERPATSRCTASERARGPRRSGGHVAQLEVCCELQVRGHVDDQLRSGLAGLEADLAVF